MKIKQGYILREVGTLAVVVAVGAAYENFHSIKPAHFFLIC